MIWSFISAGRHTRFTFVIQQNQIPTCHETSHLTETTNIILVSWLFRCQDLLDFKNRIKRSTPSKFLTSHSIINSFSDVSRGKKLCPVFREMMLICLGCECGHSGKEWGSWGLVKNRTEAEDWSALGGKNNKLGDLEPWFPLFLIIYYIEKKKTIIQVLLHWYTLHYKTHSLNRKFWKMKFKVTVYRSVFPYMF